jgi:diaminohydroxyphosphoribosylaminopyrimidine deaminase/5-amino-6-(5-phosphoribosylamino)uracil reductase
LIKANVARVFVGSRDPHPRANGVGLARLEAAGVTVTSGVLWAEADAVNAGFFLVVREGRPLVGASTDGAGFDAPFAPFADEDMVAALRRHARAGLTRVFVPPGGALAQALAARGLLSGSGQG